MTSSAIELPGARPRRSRLRRTLMHRPIALAGAVGAALALAVALLAPVLAPASPDAPDFDVVLAGPFTDGHLLGTDQLGRDVLSRLLYGSRTTIEAGVLSTLLATAIAVPIGLVAGYYRGPLDTALARLMDVLLAFPFLLLAVGLAALWGPSLRNSILALGIAQIPIVTRITRGAVLATRDLEYVQAAVVNGARDGTILRRHILPNVLSPIVVQATVAIPLTIVGAAILSFLGLGVQPPTADWGVMLAQAQGYLSQAPWLGVFPGVAIFLTALSFNLLGDAVRDALDPRMLI